MLSQSQGLAGASRSHQTAYMVGRDTEGRWLAVETHGLGGGLFANKEAALRYASSETDRRKDAVTIVPEHLALRL